jgi:hypothetical protein
MKQNRYVFTALALACVIPLFLGCPTEDDGPNYGGEQKRLPAVSLAAADGVKYFSLSTGEEVTGAAINSNTWDIAFSRTRLILTNSGATAADLESFGEGGVWYTDQTVLSEVSEDDKLGEDDPLLKNYLNDQKRWVSAMGGAAETTLNVMSYAGYDNEAEKNGLTTENNLAGYSYNKKQYYNSGEMGTYGTTDQVYIICHGDGEHYSKIQITYEYTGAVTSTSTPAKDNWVVVYQNF